MAGKAVEQNKINPKVKDVLRLLATGVILITALLVPGVAMGGAVLLREYQKYKWEKNKKEWEKFNLWRLRQIINRLEKQKVVTIMTDSTVKITKKGRERSLKYNLEEMSLLMKPDGKWRIIIYDVSEIRAEQRNLLRRMLKRLKFLQLQKSVYLTPFPCENEIEYLRQLFGIGRDVKIITATGLENEEAYKKYFGI